MFKQDTSIPNYILDGVAAIMVVVANRGVKYDVQRGLKNGQRDDSSWIYLHVRVQVRERRN